MDDGAGGAQPREEPAAAILPATTVLTVTVTAGRSGTVLVLSGESDVTTTQELDQFLDAQLAGGTTDLTIEMSGLRFADSATIKSLLVAARTLKDRGGTMTLLRPHPNVARVLSLTGADTIMAVLRELAVTPAGGPGSGSAEPMARWQPPAHQAAARPAAPCAGCTGTRPRRAAAPR
jgi:anti-sigma B factor antagonist